MDKLPVGNHTDPINNEQPIIFNSNIIDNLPKIIQRIPKTFKTAIISTFIIGLIAHLYVYTNLLIGHDASSLYYTAFAWNAMLGRISVYFIQLLHGSLNAPWALGLLELIYISLSSFFICEILKIKRTALVVLVCGIIITFPTITADNVYISDQFTIALLTACLAVYIIDRYRLGFIGGIALLILSLSFYQAYWCFAASLMLLILIRKILENNDNTIKILLKALMFIGILITSLILYYLLWLSWMHPLGLEFSSYRGVDQMGQYTLQEISKLIALTYKEVIKFFFVFNTASYFPVYLQISFWVGIVFLIVMILKLLLKDGLTQKISKIILLFVFIFLLPLAMNTMQIFDKGSAPNILMQFAFITPWLIIIQTYEQFTTHELTVMGKKKILSITSWAIIIISFLTIFNGSLGANTTYLKLQANYDSAISTSTRIINRIETTEGYTQDMPVVVVGVLKVNRDREGFDWTRDIPGVSNTALTYEGPTIAFLSQLDLNMKVRQDYNQTYSNLAKVKELNAFPSANCTTLVGNVLVVKLS